jgi:hypothetical protein
MRFQRRALFASGYFYDIQHVANLHDHRVFWLIRRR